jgi:hypothetical protein
MPTVKPKVKDEASILNLKPNRTCESCSKPFYGSPGHVRMGWARFCSYLCRSTQRNGRWLVTGESKCRQCGNNFHQKPTSIRHGRAKVWCSKNCRELATKQWVTCGHCGKECSFPKAWSGRRFCSIGCQRKALAPAPNCVCLSCHSWFYRKSCDLRRGRGVGKFCSMRCKAKWMSNHANVTGKARGLGGKRADLENRYFRSRWEANWARYLNWMKSRSEIVRWEYEVDTFQFDGIKRGGRFYTPDFKITKNDSSVEYHEVKGWMDPQSATKLKRMKKYYPGVKIMLVERALYYSVQKELWKMIPGWEYDRS